MESVYSGQDSIVKLCAKWAVGLPPGLLLPIKSGKREMCHFMHWQSFYHQCLTTLQANVMGWVLIWEAVKS